MASLRERVTYRPFILMAMALVAVAAYTAWWMHLERTVRAGMESWIAERKAAGWMVSTGDIASRGFPLSLRLTLPSPALRDTEGNAWEGPPLTASYSLLSPVTPRLTAAGRHVLTLAGHLPVTLIAEEASADVTLGGRGIVHLNLSGVTVGTTRLGRLGLDLRPGASAPEAPVPESLAMVVELEQLAFADDGTPPVTSARLEGRLMGRLSGVVSKETLHTWRDMGGTVEIDRLTLDWPPVTVKGNATLALDSEMQPLAAGSFVLRGLPEAIAALGRAGLVKPKDAQLATLVLGLVGRPAAEGGKEWALPIAVQGRVLSVGQVALMKLPAIEW